MSRRMLLEDNYSENEFKWDIEKTSNTPIHVQELLKDYFDGRNIKLNTFSNNQILEVDISKVSSGDNDPQIMLLCDNDIGGKIYWPGYSGATLSMGNNPNFALQLIYPIKLRVTLINNTFSLYINDVLQDSINVYLSEYLPFTGIQLRLETSFFATGFRYKNFE